MAMNLGGGNVIDANVPVGPRADLVQQRALNLASQREQAVNTIEMFNKFAQANGISMSHMAEDFGGELGRAFAVLNGGNMELAQQMIEKMQKMPVTQEQEAMRRSSLAVNKNRNLVDFNTQQGRIMINPETNEAFKYGSFVDPQQANANMAMVQSQTSNPLVTSQSSLMPGQLDPIMAGATRGSGPVMGPISVSPSAVPFSNVGALMPMVPTPSSSGYIPQVMSQPTQRELTPEELEEFYIRMGLKPPKLSISRKPPVYAQGKSLAQYGSNTGDVHRPALVGDREIILNKEVAKRFPFLAQLNEQYPNQDARMLPPDSMIKADGTDPVQALKAAEKAMADEETMRSMEASNPLNKRNKETEGYRKIPSGELNYNTMEILTDAKGVPKVIEEAPNKYFLYVKDKPVESEFARVAQGPPADTPQSHGNYLKEGRDIANPEFHVPMRPGGAPVDNTKVTKNFGILPTGDGGGEVKPEDKVIPEPPVKTEDPVPVPEPAPEDLRYEIYQKGVVNTPAEYETVMRDNGYFAQMEQWNQKLAQIAPSAAQFVPGAKVYADQIMATKDPKSVLELKKLVAQIDEIKAQEFAAIANGEWTEAKKFEQDIINLYATDKEKGDLEKLKADTQAAMNLAMLRAAQANIEKIKLGDMPLQTEKLMAEIAKIKKETAGMLTPDQQAVMDNYDLLYQEYLKASDKSKFLKNTADSFSGLLEKMGTLGIVGGNVAGKGKRVIPTGYQGLRKGEVDLTVDPEQAGVNTANDLEADY